MPRFENLPPSSDRNAYYRAYRKQVLATETPEERDARRAKRNEAQRAKYASDADYRERKLAGKRAAYRANPEIQREATRRWAEKNPERVKEYRTFVNQSRRVAPEDYIDPLVVLELDDGLCGVCGEEIEFGADFHVDHVIPIARGGAHALDNVQAAHPQCNWTKRDTLPWDLELDAVAA